MSLMSDLKDVFSPTMTDATFASGVAGKVADYVKLGTVVTVDLGTISGNSFTGAGIGVAGCIDVDSSECENTISSACSTMQTMAKGGDDYLAQQIATAIDKMITDAEVKTKVTGAVATPSGAVSMAGEGKGSFTGVVALLQDELVNTFKKMRGEDTGGNDKKSSDKNNSTGSSSENKSQSTNQSDTNNDINTVAEGDATSNENETSDGNGNSTNNETENKSSDEGKKTDNASDDDLSGDELFAKKLAKAVENYLIKGAIKTDGQGALEGVTGIGTVKCESATSDEKPPASSPDDKDETKKDTQP